MYKYLPWDRSRRSEDPEARLLREPEMKLRSEDPEARLMREPETLLRRMVRLDSLLTTGGEHLGGLLGDGVGARALSAERVPCPTLSPSAERVPCPPPSPAPEVPR